MREALLAAAGSLLIALLDEWRSRIRAQTAREEREAAAAAVTEQATATRAAVESIKEDRTP